MPKDHEILLYTMQAGELPNLDRIMQINEQKEKHNRKFGEPKFSAFQCTKNLLRNLNQTMLRFLQRSEISKNLMKEYFKDYDDCDKEIERFKKWAVNQKMDNFLQCRTLWSFNESTPKFNYLFLFREIQFEFFSNSSCPAIFSSKVRNGESKKTHLKYIHAFLEGIINPQRFTCFKKSGKLKEQEKEEDQLNKKSKKSKAGLISNSASQDILGGSKQRFLQMIEDEDDEEDFVEGDNKLGDFEEGDEEMDDYEEQDEDGEEEEDFIDERVELEEDSNHRTIELKQQNYQISYQDSNLRKGCIEAPDQVGTIELNKQLDVKS